MIQEVLINQRSILDVRSPIEFAQGALPLSTNAPILNDSERAQVGTIYKQLGQDAAIRLGHQLVSGDVKEQRLKKWREFFKKNPQGVVTCFRGGLRSRTAQEWLKSEGFHIEKLDGGYKKARQFLIQNLNEFCENQEANVISGRTGSGKTLLLNDLEKALPTCNLERLANHRGSAFGGQVSPQPTVINFEIQLSNQLLKLRHQSSESSKPNIPVLIEDESRMIGQIAQPEAMFNLIRRSPVVMVIENIESRTETIFQDYIIGSDLNSLDSERSQSMFNKYADSLNRLSRKLGGLKYSEIQSDLQKAHSEYLAGHGLDLHRVWIQKLLELYYDPLYERSFIKRQPKILFQGPRNECKEFLTKRSV